MFTFITIVTTPCEKFQSNEDFTTRANSFFPRKEKVVTKIERRALTAEQAQAQALANVDLTIRDGLNRVIDDAELNFTTIRKFAVELGK
jgi:phage terminase Nu1 subunit (DNA packaging protein)